MPPVKKVIWSYIINRISCLIRGPCTCTQCPRVRLKISCSSWSPRHIVLPPWMGATEKQAIKGVIKPYPCCRNVTGGWEWQAKCRNPWCPAHIACCMRAVCPRCPYTQLCQPLLWISYIDFLSIEMTMEPNRLPKVANILVFQDHFTKHVIAYMSPNRLQNQLPSVCIRVTSQSLGPWSGS